MGEAQGKPWRRAWEEMRGDEEARKQGVLAEVNRTV